MQDFDRKKYRLCLHKQYFSVKRLLFAQRCERKFGGNPPQRAEYNEACRGKGVPKLLKNFGICKKKLQIFAQVGKKV